MTLDREEIKELLRSRGQQRVDLFSRSQEVKLNTLGSKVYFRGLVEFSNICDKDCYYCGIRRSNGHVVRFDIEDMEILDACRFAWENRFGSVVLQSGEVSTPDFVSRVDELLRKIRKLSYGELGITLSCGEQSKDTYKRWRDSGAHRYLLRIESSDPELFRRIHPRNEKHSYRNRIEALENLKKAGYQVGTGVMIGLPYQNIDNLANDLLFFKTMDIDMCGMGPYLEHKNTPFNNLRHLLMSKEERFDLSFNMIAVLRLLMPDINIAAATSLEAIDAEGRERAIDAGANVVMPNLTPGKFKKEYHLYDGKPGLNEGAASFNKLSKRIKAIGCETGFGERGDSLHFFKRLKKEKSDG